MAISSRLKVEIAFGDDPFTASKTWTQVQDDTLSVKYKTSTRTSEFDNFGAGRCAVVLDDPDRDYDPTYGSSPYVNDFVWGTPVRIRALQAPSTWIVVWEGYARLFTPTPGSHVNRTTVEALDGLWLLSEHELDKISAAHAGDDIDTRIARILDEANWPSGDRDLDSHPVALQSTTYGRTALAEITQAARAGGGFIYHSPHTGDMVYESADAVAVRSRMISSQHTFGVGGSGILEGTLDVPGVGDNFRNVVSVTQTGGPFTTVGSVAATEAKKGYALTVPLRDVAHAAGLANYLYDLYSTDAPGPSALDVIVNLAGAAEDDDALAVRLRDRVTVTYDPAGAGGSETFSCFVDGIAGDADATRHRLTFRLSSADAYDDNLAGPPADWLLLDDATEGVLDTDDLGY